MSDRPFVHLHCHSHYSLLDGASRIPELIQTVKNQGMNSIALTDHGNLYGAVEFYRECTKEGINPIIGYEAYVAPGKRTEREGAKRRGEAGYHLTLLAKNLTGFHNLIKMSSTAFLDGYYYVPRIDKELIESHSEGIICLSGCASAEFSEYILQDRMDEAKELALWFHKVFGDNFYVEIQDNGLDIQKQCAEGAIDIANKLGLPLVATCDAHYLKQDDAPAHDVLLCINTKRTLNDRDRMRLDTDQFYIRPPEEMYSSFPGQEEAVKRSQEIANGVCIDIDFTARHFPVFTPPENKTDEDYLRELCEAGLKERYGDSPPQVAVDRLNHELNTIFKMGFASYFLITWDFVRYAIEQGIPNSARGSACGAIVSYCLKLSHVCPLEYNLLFERFLDPNRSEAPDIDIDFCQDRREQVIQYVREKYGDASVAQIATFGTMAARAAIKDVGRVLQIPLDRINKLTSLIPKQLGITIQEALDQSTEFKAEYDNDTEIKRLLDIAMKLEGTNRNAGTHAAGVVIADGPITNHVPVHRVNAKDTKDTKAVITTQWVMGDLETMGMLKMDFLGLRTLTLLDNCLKLIKKTRGKEIDLHTLSLDDEETYKLLQRGDAKGVFQLESDGIRELLKRMKPDNIRDIIAIMALYRPGPLGGGMVDAYVNRKHGRETPESIHPVVDEILKETHNVMVYQEDIMRILNRLGGIDLSRAYACIKAISKKKHKIIAKEKIAFIEGAVERGFEKEKAEHVFAQIEEFAKYGFNKCLVADTRIMNAETGELTTIGELFNNRREFVIHALGEDYKLHPRRVTDVVWNGRRPVFELKTRQGKTIRATSNHPFRTLNGWTNLEDLRVGDRIASAVDARFVKAGDCRQANAENNPSPLPKDVNLAHYRPSPSPKDDNQAFYPEGVAQHSPGSRSAPWVSSPTTADFNPEGVAQGSSTALVEPLQGSGGILLSENPGCAARPWAVLGNHFGVKPALCSPLRVNPKIIPDIFWDEIVSITPAGIEDTYDLTVDQDHNFVAEGLIVHNSHTAAYAQVGYHTAYLKAHYTPEFMAALLTSEIEDNNKRDIMVEHFDDARRLGCPVQQPNVNTDLPDFDVRGHKVLFGLVAIKGLGRGAAEEIVRSRNEGGKFKSIFDFCERVDHRIVTKSAMEKLVKAGAFDCFGANRHQLWQVLPRAVQAADALQQDRKRGQMSLFDGFEEEEAEEPEIQYDLPAVDEWPNMDKLKYEKEVLDFYVSSHPLAQSEQLMRLFSTNTSQDLENIQPGQEVLMGGMLSQIRFGDTRKARNGNSRYARFKLEDFHGSVECVMWPDDFVRYKDMVVDDKICFVAANAERNRDEPSLVVTKIMEPEQVQLERTKGVVLRLKLEEHDKNHIDQVSRILERSPGKCLVFLQFTDKQGKRCTLRAGGDFRVNPQQLAKEELETLLGEGSVFFSRHSSNGNGRR